MSSHDECEQHPYVGMECSDAGSAREEDEEDEDEEDIVQDDMDIKSMDSCDSSDSLSESDEEEEESMSTGSSTVHNVEIPEDPSASVMTEETNDALNKRYDMYRQMHRQGLGKPMHRGDDEGRPSKKQSKAKYARGRPGASLSLSPSSGSQNSSIVCNERHVLTKCWLCMFSNCILAKQIASFVSTNASSMDPAIMAQQIKTLVLKEYPRARGIGRRHILRHMREHMLAPTVRLASVIRSLLSLAETLRGTLQQEDADTGDLLIDKNGTELYLKVLGQVVSVYKTDSTKLIFNPPAVQPSTGGGSSLPEKAAAKDSQ